MAGGYKIREVSSHELLEMACIGVSCVLARALRAPRLRLRPVLALAWGLPAHEPWSPLPPDRSGNYIVVFDPLDGSSNIDAGEGAEEGSGR